MAGQISATTELRPPSQTVHMRFGTPSVGTAGPKASRESRATTSVP